jgi:hypothetical protein
MKIIDLRKELDKIETHFGSDKEVEVFAEGKIYPILEVSIFEGKCELSCGWVPKEEA